ncbi:MAG: pilus assembly protein [Propionibacterium sp.]|nr:pilus assembly protein [Propionibacterium sp.]MBB1577809.1 pilus assembly protein [Propionibacterium sp.]MDO4644344.1 hypothetical protein [Propionibacteriaceae bacterium]BCR81056.1 membrane protein [Arachnia rubra]
MAVEAALVLPVAMLFVGLVIVMAGQALAQQAVTAAATRAARVASLESSQASAELAARNAAVAELGSSHITCTDTQVAVDARGLASPPGTVASVTVRIVCQANFPVSLPGFPAHRSLVGEGVSPVDTYRGRDG